MAVLRPPDLIYPHMVMSFLPIFKKLLCSLAIGLLIPSVYAQSEADQKVQQLLNTLKQPVPTYTPPKVDNAVPAHLLAKKQHYEVTWLKEPYLKFTDAELQRAKTATIKMTVIAHSGLITQVEIIKSSGLKVVDAKIKDAVMAAKLEPIRGVDQNLTYTLQHDIPIKNPL